MNLNPTTLHMFNILDLNPTNVNTTPLPAAERQRAQVFDPNKGFRKWDEAGFTTELLPIIPPTAQLAPGSTVQAQHRGKTPGTRNSDGTWSGLGGKWAAERQTTISDCKRYTLDGASVGLQGRHFPGLDIDVEDAELVERIKGLALDRLGPAPTRTRTGSTRALLMYRRPEDHPPIRKQRLAWADAGGRKHAVELLGYGQQYLIEGPHKSGGVYQWQCDVKPDRLTPIDADTIAAFFAELANLVEAAGGTIVAGASYAGSLSARETLDDPSLWAPDPKLVLDALKHWRNEADNLPTHDDFVAALASIKAALGPTREEHFPTVLEWALDYPGNDPEYVQKTWDSISDSSLGWEWLASNARGAGFSDAETDFAEPPPAEYLPEPPKKISLLWEDELHRLHRAHDFVEGLLCDGQLSVVFGDANVGKSFFMLDLAYHVALGWKWRELDVDQGTVIYIAGEGAGGLVNRVEAFRKQKEITGRVPLAILPEAVNFRDEKEIARLIERVQEIKPRLIVVDTLSRALAGGNENAPDDMGALVKGVDRLRTTTGAHVSLIHHSGKDDAKGARGHSLLRAAIDTEIKIARQDGGGVVATFTKQRDLECGPPLAFKLRTVTLGTNARGTPITSCVVETAAPPRAKLKEADQEAVNLLENRLYDSPGTTVPMADWRAAVMAAENILTGDTPGVRQTQWQRLRNRLKKLGIIEIYGDKVELRQTRQT